MFMTFDQLSYFVKTYQLQSISQAADVLHISRQALSRTLKSLEDELNVTLFQRSSIGVVPTDAGEILYTSALTILNEKSALYKKLSMLSSPAETRTKYKIALPEVFLSKFGDDFANSLAEKYPQITFNLAISSKNNKQDFFEKYDFTIFSSTYKYSHRPKSTQDYSMDFLIEKPIYIWIKKGHPLQQLKIAITLNEMKKYPFYILKNTFNGLEFSREIYNKENSIVHTKHEFKSYILDNAYTIDANMNGSFTYQDIFDDSFVLLKTNECFYNYCIYKNDLPYNLVQFMKSFFLQAV